MNGETIWSWRLISDEYILSGRPHYLCRCVCGTEKPVRSYYLNNGRSRSCGCVREPRGSGYSNKRIYFVWQTMLNRCRNKNTNTYKYYGGRGISVCERWANSFDNFLADMGEPKKGMSIDRIDTNGNYCPDNCRWATRSEQMRNIRPRNSTGVSGIRKSGKFWRVEITVNYKKTYLGSCRDFFDACCMRKSAENKYWNEEVFSERK